MNKYKVFILSISMFHLCLLVLGFPPIISNIFAFIPVFFHCLFLTLWINPNDTRKDVFLKNVTVFLGCAIIVALADPFLAVGMIYCSLAILASLFLIPYVIHKKCINSN